MKTLLPICLLVALALYSAHGAPADHLGKIPDPTTEEKEVLSLLQVSKPQIINMAGGIITENRIVIPIYNPTKYSLTRFIIRISFPDDKTERIYFSEKTAIEPFTDGIAEIIAHLADKRTDTMKCDVIGVSFANKAKK